MTKDKIAISLSSDVLQQVDAQIDGVFVRSRSHAIEVLIKKGLESRIVDTAVLLIKKEHQKMSLSKFKDSTLLDTQLQLFSSCGIKHMFIVTQPSALVAQMKKQLVALKIPVEIKETSAEKNADALKILKKQIHGDFVVMSGDTYNSFDFGKMIEKHLQKNVLATMGLLSHKNPQRYGSVILDGDMIVKFQEKSSISNIINAGIYIFKPEVFRVMSDCSSLEFDLFPRLANIRQLVGHFTMGEYVHVSESSRLQP
ncbi:MAG: hypothetical protein HY832_00180 [Candidatus Aenigmarchaeota archaeon]|nr:hypothetical protein [Candidatus Aenigmarchaeota archaeon]